MKKIFGIFTVLLCLNFKANALDLKNPNEIRQVLGSLENIEVKIQTSKKINISEKSVLDTVKSSFNIWLDQTPKRANKNTLDENLADFKTALTEISERMAGRENVPDIQVETLFLKTVPLSQFLSPIEIKGSKFHILRTVWPSPKSTPSRRENLNRMLEGKQPFLKEIPIEYHHLNQKNEDKVFAFPKKFHKENHKLVHNTQKKKSEINRSKFAGIKKKSFKIGAVHNFRRWLEKHLTEILQQQTDSTEVCRQLSF